MNRAIKGDQFLGKLMHLIGPAGLLLSLPFVSFYILAGMSLLVGLLNQDGTVSPSALTMLVIVPDMLFYLSAGAIFANVWIYLVVSVLAIVIAVGVLFAQTASLTRLLAIGTIVGVAGFPLAFNYHAALSAAAGYEMINATQPAFPLSVVKVAQVAIEDHPCQYEILGWQADVLYYKSICDANSQVLAFDVNAKLNQPKSSMPSGLYRETLSRFELMDRVRADGVSPASAELSTRQLHLAANGFVSPNAKFVAFVSQHVYGPFDVQILIDKSARSAIKP